MVLRPQISPATAMVACAHGALAGYLRWKEDPIVQEWISSVFYKRIYQPADLAVWIAILRWPSVLVLTESQLDNLPVIAVFRPCLWSPGSLFDELPLYAE